MQILLLIVLLGWVESKTYTNPVIDDNFPDPGVLELPGEGYAVVVSSGHVPNAFPLLFSNDLIKWEPRGHVFPNNSWPSWTDTNMWAPEIHRVNGRYLCYYSASPPDGRHAIGVAMSDSDSPWGPYTDKGSPLVPFKWYSISGLIDPSYFADPLTGKHYALWKGDTLAPIGTSTIYLQELNEDGMSFIPGSEPSEILKNDKVGELLIVEGPWMMYKDGFYYLFYSSSWVQLSSYYLGVARANSVLGPFTKRDTPVIQTDGESAKIQYEGPGHGSVIEDKAGDWWLLYASWKYGHVNDFPPGRVMMLDKITWTEDGWPHIGVPSETPQPVPSVMPDLSIRRPL